MKIKVQFRRICNKDILNFLPSLVWYKELNCIVSCFLYWELSFDWD